MDRGLLNRNLKKMIAENKISEKDGCYQFNEHYDNWVKVDKKSTGTTIKGSNNKRLLKFKETLKETIKKKGDIFLQTFKEFKKIRKQNGKKMTEYAEYLMLRKLDRMTADENEQIRILEQSIEKVWQDVYPLKDHPQDSNQPDHKFVDLRKEMGL